MTTDTYIRRKDVPATTDSSSSICLDDWQSDRNLFFRRYIYRPYKSSFEINPMMPITWNVFRKHSRLNEYTSLLVSTMTHDVSYMFEANTGDWSNEEYKYLARHALRVFTEYYPDSEFPEIHDFREAGVSMDLDRAEELCRKMMEK